MPIRTSSEKLRLLNEREEISYTLEADAESSETGSGEETTDVGGETEDNRTINTQQSQDRNNTESNSTRTTLLDRLLTAIKPKDCQSQGLKS